MPPAARVGDLTAHGGALLPPGMPKILIEGQPAAVATNLHACPTPFHAVTPVAPGSTRVLFNGLPALRVGDLSGCGAVVTKGALRVLIG